MDMQNKLIIPDEQYEYIKIFIDNIEKISNILHLIDSLEDINQLLIENIISRELKIDNITAKNIFFIFINFNMARYNLDLNEEDFYIEFFQYCKNSIKISDNKLNKLDKYKNTIIDIVKDNSAIDILQKSFNLMLSAQKIFRSAKIITDLRPVFDNSGKNILRMLITLQLELKYEKDNNIITEYIDLDLIDIDNLQETCSRAFEKTKTLQETMSAHNFPLCITGKELINADKKE